VWEIAKDGITLPGEGSAGPFSAHILSARPSLQDISPKLKSKNM
jgi:hypothetical protein